MHDAFELNCLMCPFFAFAFLCVNLSKKTKWCKENKTTDATYSIHKQYTNPFVLNRLLFTFFLFSFLNTTNFVFGRAVTYCLHITISATCFTLHTETRIVHFFYDLMRFFLSLCFLLVTHWIKNNFIDLLFIFCYLLFNWNFVPVFHATIFFVRFDLCLTLFSLGLELFLVIYSFVAFCQHLNAIKSFFFQ